MDRRQSCLGESEPLAALAEQSVATIGAVPQSLAGRGTAHNRRFSTIPCGVWRSARPAYSRENQVRALAGEPEIDKAGSASVGAVAGPWIAATGLVPATMIVRWTIAELAFRFHRAVDQSPNMDWSHAAFFEISRLPQPVARARHAHDGHRGRNPL
jgi:hypothetical protein